MKPGYYTTFCFRADAMKKIQARLRDGAYEFAVGLLRAAR